MHPLADADYLKALRQDHRAASLVEVWQRGEKIYTITGTEGGVLTDGNVRHDDAEFRTQIDLTLQDEDGTLTPTDSFDNILEAGVSYLKAYRGLYLPGETDPRLIPLGGGIIDEPRVDESGASRTISVSALDWGTRIHADTLPSTFTIAKGQWVWYSLVRLLQDQLEDWQTFHFRGDASMTTGARTFKEGESRWTHGRSLARSIGCDLFFDDNLDLVCEPIPDVTDPVDEFVEGPDCSLLYGSKIRSLQNIFNSITVIGENTGNAAVYRATAEDRNPFSPTNIDRIGRRAAPQTVDGNVSSNLMAALMAISLLRKMQGRPERMELTALVNAGLRLHNTVRVTREALQVDTLQVLDKITFPLVPTRGMNASMRERIVEV